VQKFLVVLEAPQTFELYRPSLLWACRGWLREHCIPCSQ